MVKVELKKPIMRRIKKIFFRAIFWEMLLYSLTAFTGYFSFLDDTKNMIIDRPDLPGYKDYPMLVGRCGTLILMLVSIAVIIAPCRE
jgi:amino acid permease